MNFTDRNKFIKNKAKKAAEHRSNQTEQRQKEMKMPGEYFLNPEIIATRLFSCIAISTYLDQPSQSNER